MTFRNSPAHDVVGQTVADRYRIISRLGAGGMGVAYRAWDERSGVPMVIKIPKPVFLDDPAFAERFRREIRLLQGLSHPHVVPILDVGEHDGLPFVVLRFLPGGSLSDRRLRDDRGTPRPNSAAMLHLWLPAIAEALDHVHAQGVVHRDVKPANVFFDAFWKAYLGDFGIAKIVAESETFDRELPLTATHMGIGTQEYMSPEQFTPRAVIDGCSDQYALAVLVYELLAATRPFTGATAHLVVEVATKAAPPLQAARPDLPRSLCAAVHRALAKKPEQRFETCSDFAAAVLEDVPVMQDEPGLARLLCPGCTKILTLPTSAAGRKGRCPKCHSTMKVADDLGALWLLDEAKRQRQVTAAMPKRQEAFGEIEASTLGAAWSGLVAEDDELEDFTPAPTPRSTGQPRKKPSPLPRSLGALVVGGLLVAVAAAWFLRQERFGVPKTVPLEPLRAVRQQSQTYEQQLAAAIEKLAQFPADPQANEFVGRHWCLKEEQWDRGLRHLVASRHPAFGPAAEREIAALAGASVDPGAVMRVAKDWWDIGVQRALNRADSPAAIRKHALAMYLRCVEQVTKEEDVTFVNAWIEQDALFRSHATKKPSLSGGRLPAGLRVSDVVILQSINFPNRFLSLRPDGQVMLSPGRDSAVRLRIVAGLASSAAISLQVAREPSTFLVEAQGLLKTGRNENPQAASRATFEIVRGLADAEWVSFLAHVKPKHYVRHQGFVLKIHAGGGDLFRKDTTFRPLKEPAVTAPGGR
jgi:tRNA A-37 threonylcarbamoyl transferase component Bud32